MNKIYIVPSYARKQIMNKLVDTNNPFDKQVLSFSAFKNSLINEEVNELTQEARLFNDIKNHINKDNIFYNQLSFPAFFNYFYKFAKQLIRYDIKAEDLPIDDEQDLNKKEILDYFLNNDLIEKKIKEIIKKENDFSNLEIYDYFYPDYSDHKDIESLLNKKANLIKQENKNKTRYSCKFANNPAKEIISVAQYIISNKIDLDDCVLMLSNKQEYALLIRRIFEYYKIPYKIQYEEDNKQAQRFISLLSFIRKQNLDTFISAYNNNCFEVSDNILIEYIMNLNLDYEDLLKPLDSIKNILNNSNNKEYIINTFGDKKLKNINIKEEECEALMEKIRPTLLNIKEYINKPLIQQATLAYNHLYSDINNTQTNINEINDIEELRNVCLSIIDENDNFDLLLYELNNLKSSRKIEYEDGIRVVDVYDDLKTAKNAIILGCIQENYPKSIAISGFFDEDYIERIKNYPTLLERTEYFNDNYKKLLETYEEVIFSYPLASIDGKQYQRSSLIGDYVAKNEKKEVIEEAWEYKEIDKDNFKEEKISEENAKDLYLVDGLLKSSPSAFEKYVGCPFAYFIEKGLKIEDEALSVEASIVGNIQHNLLERYFKGDIDLNKDNIIKYLDPYFEIIKDTIKYKDIEYNSMKERLADGLRSSVAFLEEFRNSDDYKYYPEQQINNFKWKLEDNTLVFNGKIDRLDIKENNYRIIDYKSSEKTVNLGNVKKGINFQLLAYLVIYALQAENKNLNPELFAYLSLKNKKIDKEYNVDDKQLRKEEIKYKAYSLDDSIADEQFFNTSNLIKTKDKISGKSDFEYVKEIIEKLFTNISKKILSGDISIEPKNGACVFCKYMNLCHFKGEDLGKEEMEDLTE